MIPYTYFVHPEDEMAMNRMKAMPGFNRLVKKFLKVGYEPFVNGENLAMRIQLSDNQLPDIYHRVTRICDRLGIEYPDVYLTQDAYPNAWTFGDTHVSITLTSALFEYLEDDEIDSVIAHECGHIMCHHVLYHTIANSICAGVTGFFSFMVTPLKLEILRWERCSELSADRVAALISGADTVIRTQVRLAGGSKSLTNDVNIEEWAKQAERYEALRKDGMWNRILQAGVTITRDHPVNSDRVSEVLKWEKTENYAIAKKIMSENGKICPHCNQPVEGEWVYCKHCGGKL